MSEQFLKYVAVDKEGSADKEFEAHEEDLGARRPTHGGGQVSGEQNYSGIECQNKYMYSSTDSARNSGSLQFRSTLEIIRSHVYILAGTTSSRKPMHCLLNMDFSSRSLNGLLRYLSFCFP